MAVRQSALPAIALASVRQSSVRYIKSQRKYLKVVSTRKTILVNLGNHEMASLLPANRFKTIHHSFTVSL